MGLHDRREDEIQRREDRYCRDTIMSLWKKLFDADSKAQTQTVFGGGSVPTTTLQTRDVAASPTPKPAVGMRSAESTTVPAAGFAKVQSEPSSIVDKAKLVFPLPKKQGGKQNLPILFLAVVLAGCNAAERDWKVAKETNTPAAFLAFYRAHPQSPWIEVGEATVASRTVLLVRINSGLAGAAVSEAVISVDGAPVSMSTEEACKLGILQCQARCIAGPHFIETNPERTARIFREKPSRRILAIEFADKGHSNPHDAVHDAVVSGDTEDIRTILKDNPNLAFDKDAFGGTLMGEAASFGNKGVVQLLLASHADVNASADGFHDTPLHCAAANGHRDMAEALLAHGANVNAENMFGETPLHLAADTGSKGFKEVAEFLLAHGADVNAKDKWGYTPMRLAANAGNKDEIEVLRQHGGR